MPNDRGDPPYGTAGWSTEAGRQAVISVPGVASASSGAFPRGGRVGQDDFGTSGIDPLHTTTRALSEVPGVLTAGSFGMSACD
jgi:hypothetical protein